MPVTLVRHTRPNIASDICYGRTDLDVADTFESESGAVIAALERCDRIVSSPLRRCVVLATSISNAFSAPVATDERLKEMDFGRWEGLRWSDIPETEVSMWADDFLHARPHGGESVAMLRARTVAALADYVDGSSHTIIVTHSGVIKSALATGDEAQHFDTKIDFGGIVELNRTELRR